MGDTLKFRQAAAAWASDALDAALVALFPPRCVACDAALPVRPPFGLCALCFEVLEPNLGARCERCDLPGARGTCADCKGRPPTFEALRAPFLYGGPLADLIVAAKFRGREDMAAAAGRLLSQQNDSRALAIDAACCVPVPLGAKRRRQRGFNQSAIMARTLGKAWGLPVQYALRRRQETVPQSDLSLSGRRDNVRDVFEVEQRLRGCVLLVDDVVTSGETVHQAAAALLAAGADAVRVIAVARAPLT